MKMSWTDGRQKSSCKSLLITYCSLSASERLAGGLNFFFSVLAPSKVEIRLLMEKHLGKGCLCVFVCICVCVCVVEGVKPKMTFSSKDSQTSFDDRVFPCNHMSLQFSTEVPTGDFHGFWQN